MSDDIEGQIAKRLRRLSELIDDCEDRKVLEFAVHGLLAIAEENLLILREDDCVERKVALMERVRRKHKALCSALVPPIYQAPRRRRRRR